MDHQFSISKSSKAVINFALLFFWISFPLLTYMFLLPVYALITGQAVLERAIIVLLGSIWGLITVVTVPLQIVNQYNQVRVTKEGLYVKVYVFRYIWKFIDWNDILDLKLSSWPDRWGKPQWLIIVRGLTYWHRWICLQHGGGLRAGILVNSDLVDREKLLKIIEKKLA